VTKRQSHRKPVTHLIIIVALAIMLAATFASALWVISQKDNTIQNLTNITNLADSVVWFDHHTFSQGASHYSTSNFSAEYAGYVSVTLNSFGPIPTDGANIKVIYTSHGASYNNVVEIFANQTATFPILPANLVYLDVGNNYYVGSATETITATYMY
jgi:hypothetical protein